MTSLTVFTPTFNRAHTLPKLYESLLCQTRQISCWLIVDDGSTDDTKELVDQFIKEGKLNITYCFKSNGGKHTAINLGVKLCSSELFFIVDSDDFLTNDAVEKIINLWEQNKQDNISGIMALRQYPGGAVIGTRFPDKLAKSTLQDIYKKYRVTGDKAVVYRTDLLKQYPFPVFEGENFLCENIVYDRIDQSYKMLCLNEPIYVCSYLADGLSQNFRGLYRKNPQGFLEFYRQRLLLGNKIIEIIKSAAHFVTLCIYLKRKRLIFHSPRAPLLFLTFPLALFLYLKIFLLKSSDVKAFDKM